jgi:hypothetical protein
VSRALEGGWVEVVARVAVGVRADFCGDVPGVEAGVRRALFRHPHGICQNGCGILKLAVKAGRQALFTIDLTRISV